MPIASAANAQSYDQFVAFGDSTIDSGWFLTHPYRTNPTAQALYNASAAVGGGIPTTPGGPMDSQVLASYFGLTAIPVGEPGGTNYAAGGATNISYSNYLTSAPTTVSQIQAYLTANNGVANPNALYLISSGPNDVKDAICVPSCPTNASQLAIQSANDLTTAILQLHSAGARYIVVPIGLDANPSGSNTSSPLSQAISASNHALYAGLAASGIDFVPAGGGEVANAIAYRPALFGFTNILPGSTTGGVSTGGACINPSPTLYPSAWAAVCTTLVSPNAAQTYLFADDQHYTAAGQEIEADYIYSLIVAPSEVSYLAEVPVKTRASVVDAIFQQISIFGRERAVGTFNAWIAGDFSSLAMSSGYNGFPSDPGTPGMVTVGADYLWAPDWLLGGAVTVGNTSQSFSLGGNFQQNEYALSAYAAYVGRPLWFEMIASYGGLHYDTDRVVPIGITTVANTGSTSGSNASFAAEIGYDLRASWPRQRDVFVTPVKASPVLFSVDYGPVAGIILQQVYVNGFRETDSFEGDASGGFTALSYAGQVRNSAVTELGLQAGVDAGRWRPYGKLVWDHELVSDDRVVTASEPEIPFAPSYFMPAVSLGRDWGSAIIGTTYSLGRGMTAYASFRCEFGQSEMTYYGGQIGLNVALGAGPPPIKATN